MFGRLESMFVSFISKYPRDAAAWVIRLSTGPLEERAWIAFGHWLEGDVERARAFEQHAVVWRTAANLTPDFAIARALRAARNYRPPQRVRAWAAAAAVVTVFAITLFLSFANFGQSI